MSRRPSLAAAIALGLLAVAAPAPGDRGRASDRAFADALAGPHKKKPRTDGLPARRVRRAHRSRLRQARRAVEREFLRLMGHRMTGRQWKRFRRIEKAHRKLEAARS